MEKSTLKLINCVIQFLDENEKHEYTCAIGHFEYDEERADRDSDYASFDSSIFYYFENEEELKEYMEADGTGEFRVLSYEDLNQMVTI